MSSASSELTVQDYSVLIPGRLSLLTVSPGLGTKPLGPPQPATKFQTVLLLIYAKLGTLVELVTLLECSPLWSPSHRDLCMVEPVQHVQVQCSQ